MNSMRNFLLILCTATAVYGFTNSNRGAAFASSSSRIQQAAFVTSSPPSADLATTTTKDGNKAAASTIPKGPSRAKITTINSPEEYEKFLTEDDRLTLVRFHASWCKTCKRQGLQYSRLAKELSDHVVRDKYGIEHVVQEGEIRMAEIEYGANTEFCQELGITKLPTVNIYSNGRKVDGFPCGPKKYSLLLEKLDTYLRLSHEELAFEAEMNQGAALADTVLSTLNSQQKSASNSNSNKDDKPVMM